MKGGGWQCAVQLGFQGGKGRSKNSVVNAQPAHTAGVLQELHYHQPFTQPEFSSSGGSTRIWSFLLAGGAVQAASAQFRARAGIQMRSHGTDAY